jgi:hypothetical protein
MVQVFAVLLTSLPGTSHVLAVVHLILLTHFVGAVCVHSRQILYPPVAGVVDSFAWRAVDQENPRLQRKCRRSRSQDPGGRSAHTLVVEDASMYLFGGYGGDGRLRTQVILLC